MDGRVKTDLLNCPLFCEIVNMKQENLFLTADKATFALNWLLRLELYPVEETLYCLLLRKLFLNLSSIKLFIILSSINYFRRISQLPGDFFE